MSSRRTVFVTGANGFIGKHVCSDLLRGGWQVRGLIRTPISCSDARITAFIGTLADQTTLKRALADVDAVVHLAARAHLMNDRAANPLAEFRSVNVEGTRMLLEEAASAGVRRFVFISSVKAVGESNSTPWTEDVVPRPVDAYGISKLEAERLVTRVGDSVSLQTVILRLPLVYGPGMRGNMLKLFRLINSRFPLPLGKVNNRRSLIYCGNVASAISTVLEGSSEASGIFFVADRETPSTTEVVRRIATALNKSPVLFPVPEAVARAVASGSEALARLFPVPSAAPTIRRLFESLTVNTERLTRVTGYSPTFCLDEGLRATAKWYQSA